MRTYAIFFGFTDQGVRNIKDSPERVQAARETVNELGGEMRAFYGILGGEYDTMFILDAPDEDAAAKMALAIASGGNVRTRTHRLFTEDEYKEVISGVP